MYWGWKYVFNKKYSFSGYLDLFRFPWLRYRSYIPSEGSEWLMRFNYKPSKTISLFLQAREETKIRNSNADTNLYLTHSGTKRNYWINADYQVTPQLSFKTRAQFSTYWVGEHRSRGMMMLQDVTWSLRKFTINGRYALFDTDDYDNRLYVYEKDVWLAFSFPAYYGVGLRNYLLVQYSISKKVDIWLRWAHVRYTDRGTIGTGNETIAEISEMMLNFRHESDYKLCMHAVKLITPTVFFIICVGLALFVFIYKYIFKNKDR